MFDCPPFTGTKQCFRMQENAWFVGASLLYLLGSIFALRAHYFVFSGPRRTVPTELVLFSQELRLAAICSVAADVSRYQWRVRVAESCEECCHHNAGLRARIGLCALDCFPRLTCTSTLSPMACLFPTGRASTCVRRSFSSLWAAAAWAMSLSLASLMSTRMTTKARCRERVA